MQLFEKIKNELNDLKYYKKDKLNHTAIIKKISAYTKKVIIIIF